MVAHYCWHCYCHLDLRDAQLGNVLQLEMLKSVERNLRVNIGHDLPKNVLSKLHALGALHCLLSLCLFDRSVKQPLILEVVRPIIQVYILELD